MRAIKTTLLGLFVLALAAPAVAQQPQQGGLLGIYVQPVRFGGLHIVGFIPDSSASRLASQGDLSVGDVMLRLNGRPLHRVQDVFAVTNQLHAGVDYARLDLRMPDGREYFVYITPSAGGQQAVTATVMAPGKPRGGRPRNNTPRPRPTPQQGPGRPKF